MEIHTILYVYGNRGVADGFALQADIYLMASNTIGLVSDLVSSISIIYNRRIELFIYLSVINNYDIVE